MAADFPTTVKTFTTKSNDVDTIDASHVNDLQDEVNAIETLLGAGSTRRIAYSPVLTYSTTNPTAVAYNAANGGYYARFGSLVYFSGRLDYASFTGTPAGTARVSIPVTSANLGGTGMVVNMFPSAGFVTLWPAVGRILSNVAYMELWTYSASGIGTQLTATNVVNASTTLIFTGFYWA